MTKTDFLPLLDRFERAVNNMAFRGAQPPHLHGEIDREYAEARCALLDALFPNLPHTDYANPEQLLDRVSTCEAEIQRLWRAVNSKVSRPY